MSRRCFTDNESNTRRIYGIENPKAYVKDAFHEYIVNERPDVVNPLNTAAPRRACNTASRFRRAKARLSGWY